MPRGTGFRRPELPRVRPVIAPIAEPVRARMMRPTMSIVAELAALAPIGAARDTSGSKTAASSRHMGRVAAIGCIACRRMGLGKVGAQVHHIREGRIGRNDWLTLPLCPDHHTGTRMSVHMAKPALLRTLNIGSEFDLLAEVIELLEAA